MKRRTRILALLALWPSLAYGQPGGSWDPSWFWWGPDQTGQTQLSDPIHLIHVVPQPGETVRAFTVGYGTPRRWRLGHGLPWYGEYVYEPTNPWAYHFCAGHSALADGRILIAGGDDGSEQAANLYNPFVASGSPWNDLAAPPYMAAGRWYPTLTTLPEGRVLSVSGFTKGAPNPGPKNKIPELYTPPDWQPGNPANNTWVQLPSAELEQRNYPFMFVLPDGNVIDAGPGQTQVLNTSTWIWGPVIPNPSPSPAPPGGDGSAVMYLPGKIMRCGGGLDAAPNPNDWPVRTTWLFDATAMEWTVAPHHLNEARRYHNLVILPDGKVLAVGGTKEGWRGQPSWAPELWDPDTQTWTALALPAQGPDFIRGYHSTAMLLADGRVLSAGGEDSKTGQIFSPPYMTQGAPRAYLDNVPADIAYDDEFEILVTLAREGWTEPFDFQIVGVALIRLASTTHGFDMDQRYVPLDFQDLSGFNWTETREIAITAPSSPNIAPPGYYML